ncbi:MAG: DUF3553 domain-containing protein [Rhodospirillaceae bacterium]|nr:DUF3553 domain-containing protein [Rhodospirillaceae bacterium]
MYMKLTPGTFVINLKEEDWGIGQVQSAIGKRVTVNFENMGKIVLNIDFVELDLINFSSSGKLDNY